MEGAGLDLAGHKTEAVLITSRKKVEYASFQVGSATMKSQDSIRYLGVMLDNRLSYRANLEYVSQKASRMQAALSRILPNIGGPKAGRRLLLSRVVASILLYADDAAIRRALGVRKNGRDHPSIGKTGVDSNMAGKEEHSH
ncbi:uncharacterized protein LOC121404394 [Drosophila obscura]|uniref:uncharacterized protein LOC121404394 n=1 Tax=Drosophila obscura TaxID=7282 RepID=UPI001BB0DD56|nr:uncharacterized protein LOC121404394 [Drosophila obscura]